MLRDRPDTNGCRSEARNKQAKKQDGPAQRGRKKRGKKEQEEKHEPLLACSSSPAQLLLLLRGKAPALQISATSNVRYRLLTLAHTGTAPACWWRRSDVLCRHSAAVVWEARDSISCALRPVRQAEAQRRAATGHASAMPSISYPAHRLHQCIHTAPGLIPSGRRLRHTRPLGPEMGALLISSHHPSPAEKDER